MPDPQETREETLVRDGIEYEEVSADDQVIGKAFRVSGGILIAIVVLVTGIVWWLQRPEEQAPAQVAEVDAPREVVREVATPMVPFTDVTAASGIDFVHENGARGEKLLPETMGGGSAFFDHDDDGDADLLLVNGTKWKESDSGAPATQHLYSNDGRGRFTDVSANAGLDVSFYGMGAWCADVDGDGDREVFFTAVGPNHLFDNEGGRFTERDAGVRGAEDSWSSCAAFFDPDRDGDLDLYVGNYVQWWREKDFEVDFRLTGVGRAYGPPTSFEGTQPYFYRNDGRGTYADVTAEAGFLVTNPATGVPVGKALGARVCDLDGDGDLDLAVANDTVANFLYRNRGDGTFEESASRLGLAFDKNGKATGAMGIDMAWYRNDGTQAIAIGNFANEMTSYYVSQGTGDSWTDEAIGSGIGAPTRKYLKFGTLFLDYDLDGRMDLLQINGHLEPEITLVQKSQSYEQPPQLFWNAGNEQRRPYVEVDPATLGDLAHPIVGRGSSCADVDGDGDLDLVLTQSGGRALLLRNDLSLGHHWLRLSLVGKAPNHDAIGARVVLEAGGARRTQELAPQRSYLSQVELPLTFGLGTVDKVDVLEIRWPDGTTQRIQDPAVDQVLVVRQGT
jgi:hypothetical protein